MAQSPSLGSVRQALIPGRGFQLSGLDAARTAPRPAGWRIPVARIRGAGKNREVIAFADHWKAVTGLGHDQPTLIIANDDAAPARKIIQAYARRMNIEQRLAEAIQAFSLDALADAVPLNADLDVVLSVLAHTVCAALRRRLPGYSSATPDTLQRRFLSTGGIITSHRDQITIRLNRRTYSPVLRQASLPETITVPWWEGRTLRYEYA